MMVFFDDALFESGMKDRLKALQEIGGLLQLAKWEDGYKPNLYHIGGFISSTIEELFEELHELEDLNKQAFQELQAKVPADPEALAEDKRRNGWIADDLAEKLIKRKPEIEEPLKKILAPDA
jgi:hypothetical protein